LTVSHSFCLVVNPAAGGGRGERHLPEALGALAADSAPAVRVCPTTSLSHAGQLAEQATARQETVVAVGGDGLVGAVAGAVSRAGGLLGIIPAGRGNDFARMLGIPAQPAAAARALLSGEPRAVDLIGVQSGDGQELVVAGSVYLGVPSEAGEIANRSWWARGPAGYQLAAVSALLGWRPATFAVDLGGSGRAGREQLPRVLRRGGQLRLPGRGQAGRARRRHRRRAARCDHDEPGQETVIRRGDAAGRPRRACADGASDNAAGGLRDGHG
jgi:diacylglycerol kinase family enzyme